MLSNIKAVADKFGCEFREDAPMSDYTSFKTGGPAELVIMPNSIEALSALISACRESEIKPYIIGNGSNILVSDNGLRGVVLRLAKGLSELKCLGDGVIYADAGVSLSKLCAFALSNNLSGLEFAYGIPGTAGGDRARAGWRPSRPRRRRAGSARSGTGLSAPGHGWTRWRESISGNPRRKSAAGCSLSGQRRWCDRSAA